MLIAIFQHTPVRVWVLLGGLVALGLTQARTRNMGLTRITALPIAMLALSLAGVVSKFGHLPEALLAWAAAVAATLWLAPGAIVAPRGATWDASANTVSVPGSWLPLALIVGLFAIKYVAGASLALHPELAADRTFASLCSLAYGVFSGLFAARALKLRRVALAPVRLQVA